MSLTVSQMCLIRSIAENDIGSAKKWALVCCKEDKTQKNESFTSKYISKLEKPFELPSSVKDFINLEDISETFNMKRYYLSDREREVSEKIMMMAKVSQRLKELNIPYRNATLLYGRSGTGKTTFGRYIAYKCDLPFCYLNFSTLIDSYMGATSKNISNAFMFANNTPCVFMLDEIDTICDSRSSSSGNGCDKENNRITVAIMQELDKLSNDTILLAATNRADRIDSAVLRRFSITHEVKLLNDDERIEMLDAFLHDVGVDFSGERIKDILRRSGSQSEIISRAVEEIAADISSSLEQEKAVKKND